MNNLLGYAVTRKQTRCALLETWLSEGSIDLMDGTRRATPETAITTQTVLATFTLAAVAGTATNGVFTGALPDATLVLADGSPTWAVVKDSSGNPVFDCDAGGDGSGAVIEMPNTNLVTGALVSITSFSLAEA